MDIRGSVRCVLERFGAPVRFVQGEWEQTLPCLLKPLSRSGGDVGYLHTVIGIEMGGGGKDSLSCLCPAGVLKAEEEYRAVWQGKTYLVSALGGQALYKGEALYDACVLLPMQTGGKDWSQT